LDEVEVCPKDGNDNSALTAAGMIFMLKVMVMVSVGDDDEENL